jgi:hypothetical protein
VRSATSADSGISEAGTSNARSAIGYRLSVIGIGYRSSALAIGHRHWLSTVDRHRRFSHD